jgi:hypothetical protein
MTAQSFSTGGTTNSPFTSGASGTDEVSRYIPFNDQKSPLSGAFPATGTPGYSTGAGLLGTEVVRSDGLRYRPIMFYSLSMPFTASSASIDLQISPNADASGGTQSAGFTVASTVTWDRNDLATATSALQYAVSQCTTADAASTFYLGFNKNDSVTVTFRRGASSNTTIAPNGIYEDGVLDTVNWGGTALRATVSWGHIPNHPTSLTATTGSAPGEVNLSWTAPTDSGGWGIYGYRIAYKQVGGSTWSVYGTNTYLSPSATGGTTETVRGLVPGQQYQFVVAALNQVCDRYAGQSIYPDSRFADFTSTTAHTGQNSNIVTGTAASMPTVAAKFGVHNGTSFVKTTPQAYNGSSFVNGVPYVFDGTYWQRSLSITGGTVSTYTSGGVVYTVRTFTGEEELVINECQAGISVDYLVVAGGGGGGGRYMGGGGGAGGMRSGSATLTAGAYPIFVGAGGAGGGTQDRGRPGKDSSFNGIVSKGGGGGGAHIWSSGGYAAGMVGGSGGGTSGYALINVPAFGAAAGTAGQGNAGGVGATYGAGGGGGAGGVGSNGTAGKGGAGGIGATSTITGSSVYYAGGGGGGSYTTGSPGALGGTGGGGNGAPGPNTTAGGVSTAGTNGLGGGGGGANGYGTATGATDGSNGGSGVVIIRYASGFTV